jgi:hypothetical protein
MDKEHGMKQHIAPTLKEVIQASLDRGRERDMEERRAAGVFIEPTKANDAQVGGNHYQKNIQPWDYIIANNLGYLEGNVVKYVSRWKDKGGVQDLKKAQHYLQKLIEVAEKNNER